MPEGRMVVVEDNLGGRWEAPLERRPGMIFVTIEGSHYFLDRDGSCGDMFMAYSDRKARWHWKDDEPKESHA